MTHPSSVWEEKFERSREAEPSVLGGPSSQARAFRRRTSGRAVNSTSLDRRRLAAVLGMLGSAHDGEVLAAARQAERIPAVASATWPQLLDGRGEFISTEAYQRPLAENNNPKAEIARLRNQQSNSHTHRPWGDSTTPYAAAAALLDRPRYLTGWEIGFPQSLRRRNKRFTPKQIAVLWEIGMRVDDMIHANERGAA